MAEPTKTPEAAPPSAQVVDTKALNEAIVQGLSAGLKPVIEQLHESSARAAQPRTVAEVPPAAIVRPSEEQLADALIDGNKAEYARLLRLQRQADEQVQQQRLGQLQAAGSGAIGSMSKQLASNLPYYSRFQKEIDAEVEGYQAANPGAIVTVDHYRYAHDIVAGRHISDISNEVREEAIRKAREPEPEIVPANGRRLAGMDETPQEPTSIDDLYPGFSKEIAGRGRTVEQQLSKMGFKGGFKEVLNASKEIDKLQEEFYAYDPKGLGCGLDMDWTDSKGRQGKQADKNDGAWSK